jgi:hypothetical protein
MIATQDRSAPQAEFEQQHGMADPLEAKVDLWQKVWSQSG